MWITMNRKCIICGNKASNYFKEKAYCGKHYMQMRRKGFIYRTRYDSNEIIINNDNAKIILYDKKGNQKGFALINAEDVTKCQSIKWHLSYRKNKPYCFGKINNKNVRLHRFILNYYDLSKEIDHINGDGLDNRKENLRICTHQENMMNQRVLPSNNSSGFIGIYMDKKSNKWIAQIKVNGKHIHLGTFENLDDATQSRKEAEIKYFGLNKCVNYD